MLREKLGIGKVVDKHEIAPLKVKKRNLKRIKLALCFSTLNLTL